MPRMDVASPGESETLVPSGTRTTNGQSATLPGWGRSSTMRVQLDVTAASGLLPSLAVVIEDTLDDGANYNTVATFTTRTGAGREVVNITTPFSDTLRVRWTVAGTTPSFTFSVRSYSE